jgi:mRNA (guanine-N7-)-methyltransferase
MTTPSAQELTNRNYTRHADPSGASDMEVAVQKRKDGPAYELKSFHNDVKDALVRRFTSRIPRARILDVGCGRGGDVWKYARLGPAAIASVVGIDVCDAEIREAKVRYETIKKKYPAACASFHVIDAKDPAIQWPIESMSIDVVSFMFCLHYMFDSNETLSLVLRRAFDALVPGGYCIGTITDGDAVLAYAACDDAQSKENEVVSIDMDVAGPGTYRMTLMDTVIDDIGTFEYVSRESQFLHCAENVGFVPITSYDLDGRVNTDQNTIFKRFMPRYSGDRGRAYERASSLYSTFCLRKIIS